MTGHRFIDLDALIIDRMGMPITEIFSEYGEEYFRKIERECLLEKLKKDGFVMALGGGAISDPDVINKVKSSGFLIFLRLSIPQLVERLSRNRRRPLLLDEYGEMKSKDELTTLIQDLYKKRMPQYLQADYIVDIPENYSAGQSARLVFETLEKETPRD